MSNAYIKRKGCHVSGGALTNYNNYVLPTLQKLGVCTLHHGHNVQCRGFSTHTHALITITIIAISLFMITVEPPNKGHFGSRAFVLFSEVVLWWEVRANMRFIAPSRPNNT